MVFIEAMHARQQFGCDRFCRNGTHLQARLLNRLALAADVAALVGVETGEIILKVAVAGIAPEALLIQPGGAASGFGVGAPSGVDVEEVAAQQLVALTKAIDQAQHQRRARALVFAAGDEEAVAQDRAQRAHAQQLGVVAQAQLPSELREGLIKDELAVAMAFDIERRHSNQLLLAPQAEVASLPTLGRNDAAGALQGFQPGPAVEGQPSGGHQGIPIRLRNLRQLLMPARLQGLSGVIGLAHRGAGVAAKPNQATARLGSAAG